MTADDRHLTPEQVTAFLTHSLRPAERAVAARHLDACAECRNALMEVGGIIAGYRDTTRPPAGARIRRLLFPAALAVAASLAAIVVYRGGGTATDDPVARATDRPSADGGVPAIEVIEPPDGARVADSVVLRWRSAGDGPYDVSFLSEDGRPLWTAQIPDTVVRIPSTVALQPGATYFWRVDAMGNGIVATTGVRRLTVP
jgi:hypothetical protein